MLYAGNDAKWCSWMCTVLLIGYVCRNSATFCKMEAQSFAQGRCLATHSARSRATGRREKIFWNVYPFYMLGAEFVFRDRAKRKGKDFSLSSEVSATDEATRCTFFWSDCYWRSKEMQDWGSTDRRFPHSRRRCQSSFPRCQERQCYSK